MGSVSAMGSIKRVLDAHAPELSEEIADSLPAPVARLSPAVALENRTYEIAVELVFEDGARLPLSSYEIDALSDRFPCCEIGY